MLAVADYQRPPKLYRYSQYASLERSRNLGEFRLVPAVPDQVAYRDQDVEQILPFKSSTSKSRPIANFLTLSLSNAWNEKLFDPTSGADACLIIHDAEQFGERIHRAVRRLLPNWAGIDAAISYGMPSPLGAMFCKGKHDADQNEWLFAWRPIHSISAMHSVVIEIGSIESIAELRRCTFKADL